MKNITGTPSIIRYVKHTPTYIKAEMSKHKTIHIKMDAIEVTIFDGEDGSLTLQVGLKSYRLCDMNVLTATEIVSYAIKL